MCVVEQSKPDTSPQGFGDLGLASDLRVLLLALLLICFLCTGGVSEKEEAAAAGGGQKG